MRKLLKYDEIPAWIKDNQFITHGYRPVSHSIRNSLSSIFDSIHNESVNIHSHLWGAAFFVFCLFALSTDTKHQNYSWKDYVGFSTFILSAITCLSFSFLYHTFSNHSKTLANTWHALDYAGICILIAGSFIPSIYYGFYCSPTSQLLYMAAMLIASSVALYIVLHPHYRRPSFRKARTSVFIALGLSSILPIVHALYMDGLDVLRRTIALDYVLASGSMYIIGALIYAARFPEAYFTHRNFSYYGASHQIFHLFVVAAAVCHYFSILSSQSFYSDPEFDYCSRYVHNWQM